jgi:hypothetical protein
MTDKKTTNDVLDATQDLGEQLVSAAKQGQGLALEAARAWAQAWSSVPSSLSEIRNAVPRTDVQAITAYTFDVAAQLLAAQKDFAVMLASTLTPGKTA